MGIKTALLSVAVLVLAVCVSVSVQDCNSIHAKLDQFNFRRQNENQISNEILLNVSDPTVTRLTLTSSPSWAVMLFEPSGAGNTRWIVQVNGSLDAETINNATGNTIVQFTVQCVDRRYPANNPFRIQIQLIVLDVNELPPKFKKPHYFVNVTENTPIGTEIFSLNNKATDPDVTSVNILYSIQSSKFPYLFSSTDNSGIYLNGSLDYDFGEREYNINITATEDNVQRKSSTALLTVNVLNVDDLSPRFTESLYNATLIETNCNQTDNYIVETEPKPIGVTDIDDASELIYSIIEGNDGSFVMLSNSSLMVTGQLRPETSFSLTIRVEQKNRVQERNDEAIVLIYVKDCNKYHPQMTAPSYSGSVWENSVPGTSVATVNATDADLGFNAAFEYLFTKFSKTFEIDQNGVVRVRPMADIDREETPVYNLQVYAQEVRTAERWNSSISNLTITVLDVNDNSPVFNNTVKTYDIPKNEKVDTEIGYVQATDTDAGNNSRIIYTMIHTSAPQMFTVNETSGTITLNSTLGDDYIGPIYVVIMAQDQAPRRDRRSAFATVTINVLDVDLYTPEFNLSVYNVSVLEDRPPNSLLTQLHATDGDARDILTYSIKAGNDNGTFGIDSSRGLLTLVRSLHRERQDRYKLTVEVSDGEKASTAIVNIEVKDINNNSPMFNKSYEFSVEENVPVNNVVGTVHAYDLDAGNNKEISFSLFWDSSIAPPFAINATSGIITTTQKLSYSVQQRYDILISAKDDGTPPLTATTNITINVQDVNDHAPVFVQNPVKLAFQEGHSGFVVTVTAVDTDGESNAKILYIQSGGSSVFEVLDNGTVIAPNRVAVGEYNVTVTAYNEQPYVSTCSCKNGTLQLQIRVTDVNNNKPRFNQSVYEATIKEGSVKNPVLSIYATDNDTDPNNNQIQYSIVNNNIFPNIYISASTGEIYIFNTVDYDPPIDEKLFNFTVTASNVGAQDKTDTAVVTITVEDVNDNTPTFTQAVYDCKLNEATTSQTFGCTVEASDKDSGQNGEFQFTIVPPFTGPFTIDRNPVDGKSKITRNGTVDYDTQRSFTFEVRATDKGTPPRNSTCQVRISVEDVNNHPPKFINVPYIFSILETAGTGTEVGTVAAEDSDSNTTLTFTLLNHTDTFSLDRNSGLIKTTKTFDRGQQFALGVEVSDGVHQVMEQVEVTVVNVNEHTPQFIANGPFDVEESAGTRTFVGTIRATDADLFGPDGTVTYSMIGGNTNDSFSLGTASGNLTVSCCLDYENQKQYTLLVGAKDGGQPPLMNFTTVTINVIDVDDEGPAFERDEFYAFIKEGSPNGRFILQLKASDPDTQDKDLLFSFPSPIPGIAVNTSGTVYVAGVLDADGPSNILSGNVEVTDGKRTASSRVRVTIEDVNDNNPVLVVTKDNFTLPENSVPGHVFETVSATDKDRTNGGFTYWLTGTDGMFNMNSTSGEISVADYFDRSKQDQFQLVVHVSDFGQPPRYSEKSIFVLISDSNSAPVFNTTQDTFEIYENATLDTSVGQVVATDSDHGSSGEIDYRIVSGNQDGVFGINVSSGEILLKRKLDYEKRSTYDLKVEAKDRSFSSKSSTSTVTINVLDIPEAPEWPLPLPVIYMVKTESCNRSRLTAFSQDVLSIRNSGSLITYRLLNETQFFSIDNSTGLITAIRSALREGQYALGIEACNFNHPDLCSIATLFIHVTSEATLVFCPAFLTVDIKEDASLGATVVNLNTTVTNGIVLFSIISGNTEDKFSIENQTGIIRVKNRLDRETTARYTLLVQATNGTQTAQSQVIVIIRDVKDSIPTFPFTRYDGEVSENAQVGDPVFIPGTTKPLIVTARDNDLQTQLTYDIDSTSDNSNGRFGINATTGEIYVANLTDRETMPTSFGNKFTFNVSASDESNSTSTMVIVDVLDVNDKDPLFDSPVLNITVPEDITKDSVITRVNASDPDSSDAGKLRFSMLSASTLPFAIDPTTGDITVTASIDRETTSSYHLTIVVRDTGDRNATMTVNVFVSDVNDERPTFNQTRYTFYVDEGPDGVNNTFTVSAFDRDENENSRLTFSIFRGGSQFSVVSRGDQGLIRLDSELDREGMTIRNGTGVITFSVKVVDNGNPTQLSSTCTVEMLVLDVNDNNPSFNSDSYTGSILENSPNNTQIPLSPTVLATDPDNGENGTAGIRYSLEPTDVPFRIHATTGHVFAFYTTNSEDIDREKRDTYNLQIKATDEDGNGRSSRTNLSITILDANDSPPKFNQSEYMFNILESIRPLSEVGMVFATDPDVKGSIVYRIVSDQFRFYMTGDEIRVAGYLDRESQSNYTLNVSAFDGVHTDYTTVLVNVLDVNDKRPVFFTSTMMFSVKENEGNVTVGVVTAYDDDEGVNQELTFFINDTAIQKDFAMMANGTLVAVRSFDRETTARYIFPVYVQDHGAVPFVSSASITVQVLDVNDNPPLFCQNGQCDNAAISANILEKSPAGSVVALPYVEDKDAGNNSRVTFSLVGDGSDLFTCNLNTGLIRIAKQIEINKLFERGILSGNFTNNATFDLTIVAKDHGRVPLKSNITLHLVVQEINDGAPSFTKQIYNFSIPEERDPGYFVGTIAATAANSTGTTFAYSIIEAGDAENRFKLNKQSGSITTAVKLDREVRAEYSFAAEVRDGRVPERTAYAMVVVLLTDINDNSPLFTQSEYTVSVRENVTRNDLIKVTATDKDSPKNADVTYSLVKSQFTDHFALDSNTGQLSLQRPLDRETYPYYLLTINATDNGSPPEISQTEVNVTVIDINDNKPEFLNTPYLVSVQENTKPGQSLLTVTASDQDSGLNGQIIYQIPAADTNTFQIGPINGVLSTVGPIDFESSPVITVEVTAHDLGVPSLSSSVTVTVYVNDTYDTKPKFAEKFHRVSVEVGSAIGMNLNLNLTAGTGRFHYNITAGNEDGLFDINANNGEITVAKNIQEQGQLLLTVMASDLLPVQSFDTTEVYVVITPPGKDISFEKGVIQVGVQENKAPPVILTDLNTPGETRDAVRYSLLEQTDIFAINESTGILTCMESLDRENKAEYKLRVQVVMKPLVASRARRAVEANVVEVVVKVGDVNDNSPVIQAPGHGSKTYGIPSTANSNYLVVTLEAKDTDEGDNSDVRFAVSTGDTAIFGIDPISGEIRSLVSMTTVTVTEFPFKILATDKKGLGQSTSFTFKIIVVNENQQFGLVANMPTAEFNKRSKNITMALADLLDVNIQLETIEPHTKDGKMDLTKSDVYFHAINRTTGQVLAYSEIRQLVINNQAAVNALLGGTTTVIRVIPIPESTTPTVTAVRTKYTITEAEIAMLVIAGVMFVGSIIAVVAIIRIWKQYEEWYDKQDKARKVRERQRKITEDRTVDEGFNEVNVDSDTAEPLDLDASEESGSREFNPALLLRPTKMSETLRSLGDAGLIEEQEEVMNLGIETKNYDTIVLRNLLVSRELDNVLQMYDDAGETTSDSGTGYDIDETNVDGVNGDAAYDNATSTSQSEGGDASHVNFTSTPQTRDADASYANVANTSQGENKVAAIKVGTGKSSLKSNKNSVKSNKGVTFTKVVDIGQIDCVPSAANPLYGQTLAHESGEQLTWF